MCELENSFDCLPEEIRNLYKIDDCYDWENMTEEKLREFEEEVYENIEKMINVNKEWEEKKDIKLLEM